MLMDTRIDLFPIGPSSVSSVSVAGCSVDSVTLVWEDTSSVPTRYVLSATPTVENCEPSCTVSSPTMEYTFTGLEGGESYSVAVQADNCNGIQQGEEVTVDLSLSGMALMSKYIIIHFLKLVYMYVLACT